MIRALLTYVSHLIRPLDTFVDRRRWCWRADPCGRLDPKLAAANRLVDLHHEKLHRRIQP